MQPVVSENFVKREINISYCDFNKIERYTLKTVYNTSFESICNYVRLGILEPSVISFNYF